MIESEAQQKICPLMSARVAHQHTQGQSFPHWEYCRGSSCVMWEPWADIAAMSARDRSAAEAGNGGPIWRDPPEGDCALKRDPG